MYVCGECVCEREREMYVCGEHVCVCERERDVCLWRYKLVLVLVFYDSV